MRCLALSLLFFAPSLFADPIRDADPTTLAPIRVEDVREKLERSGKLKDTIAKTEVITGKKIEKKQAKTLTEAIANEPGIDAATGCSICGMKRVQINGLKGEYTTILVDDVPVHSTVSSYYGMDALTTAGVARIEVARGAGASLLAPGALGGVINIISEKAVKNGVLFDAAAGNREYRTFSMVGNAVSEDGKRRTTISAQHNHQGQWDADDNGVNESPLLSNYALGLRFSDDLSSSDNLDLRLGLQKSDIFGGPMTAGLFATVTPLGDPDFVGDDVRSRYSGPPSATLEAIQTERLEGTGKWTHRFSDRFNSVITASGVKQTQDSFYEGNDYRNNNETFYADGRLGFQWSDSHFLTGGADARHEILRSDSNSFFGGATPKPKDDFDSLSFGGYLQDTWTPRADLEISTAVRLDRILVNWRGQTVQTNEVDTVIPVPRIHARWNMSETLTQRLSVGQGYRAPLTFFESEHGILKDGFGIAVTDLERSTSAVYSLSFDSTRTTGTLSASWTNIQNMATIQDVAGVPTLQTSSQRFDVFSADAVAGYQLTKHIMLGASYEHFFYSNSYKSRLPFAAIEDRARLLLDVEAAGLDFNLTATFVGGRDLTPYGYGNRFNVFPEGGVGSSPKLTESPLFMTLDSRVSYQFAKDFKLYVGVKNILDFTQAGIENPLFFEADASEASGRAYDVTHLWGPVRGREFYLGAAVSL